MSPRRPTAQGPIILNERPEMTASRRAVYLLLLPVMAVCGQRPPAKVDPLQSVTSDRFLVAKITSTALICVTVSGIAGQRVPELSLPHGALRWKDSNDRAECTGRRQARRAL